MQTVYSQNMNPAFAGMLADLSVKTVDSRAAQGEISLGFGVVGGTNPEKQVKVPSGNITGFQGVALHQAKEQDASGKVTYKDKDTVPVLTKGRVWVPVIGAVAYDGDVYLIHTGANAGKFTGSAGANQGQVGGAKFKTSTSTDGLAVLELK